MIVENRRIEDDIKKARANNESIKSMMHKIEDVPMQINIREITETADKIIDTIEREPKKIKKAETFFDFYLPATVKILKRYDEIENQRLISKDSREFMQKTQKQIAEVNVAFKKQLSGLYQSDIVDTDAELRVLDMMLKSEGLDSSDLDVEDK